MIAACTALGGGLLGAAPAFSAPAASGATPSSAPTPAATTGGSHRTGRVADPDKKLGKGWKTSRDRAVTAAADADGLHILTADSTKAYAWSTAAILSEPALPADSWIGNQCVMDRDHVAVVYAPRTFTNKPDLFQGGAFTAIVNTTTGTVTKLGFTASLAYFDPTCNTSAHTAAFTSYRDMNDIAQVKTRVVTVNTAGKELTQASVKGEITSAAPVTGGAIGARGRDLVRLGDTGRSTNGRAAKVASAGALPFDITPLDAKGTRLAFVARGSRQHTAKVWQGHGSATTVASGKPGDLDVTAGEAGKAFLTGEPTGTVHTKGTGIGLLDAPAGTDVSTQGRLVVDPVLTAGVRAGLHRVQDAGRGFTKSAPGKAGSEQPAATQSPETLAKTAPVTITATATSTGTEVTQQVTPEAAAGSQDPSPALSGTTEPVTEKAPSATARAATADADAAHDPTDPDRWCSISRNDVNAQTLQPTPNQVEWAVDMAVRGDLTSAWIRQGGYRDQAGLTAVDPQGTFKKPTLTSDPDARIPANVLLGIMAQESNLWQAESGAVPGQMGNPLAAVDGYYGHKSDGSLADYWQIHWDKSDCGYGVGQVTDGMRIAGHPKTGETLLDPKLQKLVAVDYASNIAASMKILADKWNEVHEAGQTVTVNNDDPAHVENWFTAVWNYNLGFNQRSDEGKNGNWGLGWYNNPANPVYKNDKPFMDTVVDPEANHDAAHPQDWPYEEKVMGWSAWSIDTGFSYATSGRQDWAGESGFSSAGFRPAWWVSDGARSGVSPDKHVFCNEKNNCDVASPPDCPDSACYTKYWWNQSNATWKNCETSCGNENIKYATLVSEPGRGYRLKNGTPVCSGAPSGSTVVASVPNGTPTWSDCGSVSSSGTFRFTFAPDTYGNYEAKADLHQIGGGYGGHFWYTHTRDTDHLGGTTNGPMTIRGTWIPNGSFDIAQVYVHVPDTGAQSDRARYEISGAVGGPYNRYVDQSGNSNKWVSLGAFKFDGTPGVSLSNYASNGDAEDDIAYGAVAFKPITGTFVHRTLTAASVFDPNQELNSNWPVTDLNTPIRSEKSLYDWATELSHGTDGGPLWDGTPSNSVTDSGLTGWNVCSDGIKEDCIGPKTYAAGEKWYQDVKAGGYTPTADGSVPSMSVPKWMGMANARPDPSASPGQAYQDPNTYKIKSDVDVMFVKDATGHIISGSQSAGYDVGVGNAHLPTFVTDVIKAISADYGIPAPDLTYTTPDALEYGHTYTANPLEDGDTPGQAYMPHLRGARVNSDNTCVDIRAVGGGVHGYRAMVGHKSINDNVKAWVDKVDAHPDTVYAVRRAAEDIYSMFFKNSGSWNNNMWGTMIGNAPPIWHDIAAAFCADGSVKPTHEEDDGDMSPGNALVFQSYMPDLYVYVDGKMTDNIGRPSSSRVHGGDWRNFSNFPATAPNGNAFGSCDAYHRGSGGNPWSVDAPVPVLGDGPGNRPSGVVHCDEPATRFTTIETP